VAASALVWLAPLTLLMKSRRSVAALAELPGAGSPHVECLRRIGQRWKADLHARFGSGLRGSVRLCVERVRQRLAAFDLSRRK